MKKLLVLTTTLLLVSLQQELSAQANIWRKNNPGLSSKEVDSKQSGKKETGHNFKPELNRLTIGSDLIMLPMNGFINLAPEYKINRNTGIGMEFGYSAGAPGIMNIGSGKLDRQAMFGGVYMRQYLHKDLLKSIYFGAGASFLRETFFRTNDWYRLGDQYYHYEAAAIKKQAFGFYLQIGKRARFFKKLYLDTFANVGAKATQIRHGALDAELADSPILGGIMSRMDRREGMQIAPTFRVGVRINAVVIRR